MTVCCSHFIVVTGTRWLAIFASLSWLRQCVSSKAFYSYVTSKYTIERYLEITEVFWLFFIIKLTCLYPVDLFWGSLSLLFSCATVPDVSTVCKLTSVTWDVFSVPRHTMRSILVHCAATKKYGSVENV